MLISSLSLPLILGEKKKKSKIVCIAMEVFLNALKKMNVTLVLTFLPPFQLPLLP